MEVAVDAVEFCRMLVGSVGVGRKKREPGDISMVRKYVMAWLEVMGAN